MFEFKCPRCQSESYRLQEWYQTKQNGKRRLFRCLNCHKTFSETHGSAAFGITIDLSRVAEVLRARNEGLGFNACARSFRISRDTLRNWEKRFASLQKPLYLYALCHNFLEQMIEGDELYTKVAKSKKASESEGWTIVLMERASRFIWHMECGKKYKRLFKKAIACLAEVAKASKQTTLITDGEKCYGATLFEVCSDVILNGKRGRPKKLFAKGCG